MSDGGRTYAGRSGPERRAARRARLVQAGLQLFGTDGWTRTSIERLCTEAGVATRSFYEEFASREQLLLAVYDEIIAGAVGEIRQALVEHGNDPDLRTRAGVAAYIEHLTTDPRRARVVNREVRAASASREVQQHRRQTVARLTEFVAVEVRQRALPGGPERRRVLALALSGAVNEVLGDWVAHPEPRPPVPPMVEELARLYVVALAGAPR